MKTVLLRLTTIIITALFLIACNDSESIEEKNYSIIEVYADGSAEKATTKLFFTFNESIPDLTIEDIKIDVSYQYSFPLITGDLKKKSANTYELELTPGGTGSIRVGLNPYRGFTGWSAKTVRVIADFFFDGAEDITIIGYGFPIKENKMIIPDNIIGTPVVAIGNNAFQFRQLTEIFIPNTVKSIGNAAFNSNKLTSLENIIPDSVTRIGSSAFANNQITNIKIPVNIENIGNGAFAGNKINKLEYFKEDKKEEENEEDTIPPRPISKLVRFSGFNNNELAHIEIPISVREIGEFAFAYNQIDKIETWVYVMDDKYLSNITAYQEGAFMYNKLKRVRFFEGTKTIGKDAFSNNQIETVTFGSNITTIESGAFAYNIIKTITIPNEVIAINEGTFRDNQLTEIIFSNNVKNIGNEAFRNNQLEEVNIPGNVTQIGNEAFRNNPLVKITIGKNVTLGLAAFGDGFESAYNIRYEKAAGTYIRDIAANEWTLKEEEDDIEDPGDGEEGGEIETGIQSKSLFTSVKIML